MCVCVCVCERERERERERACKRKREIDGLMCCQFSDPMFFKIFTTMSFSIVTQKLKTSRRNFLNSVFKHPKIRNIIQTLLNKILY